MATADLNGVQLSYEISGNGKVPLILVHGSWVSRRSWDSVVPGLTQSLRILSYDRRGHSESERPMRQGSVHEDFADLAALIEHAGLAPAWVAGSSFGASIALRLAGDHPALLKGVIGHEPPLFSLLANDPAAVPILAEVRKRIGTVLDRIASGDHAGAAEQFVETVALGPGAWSRLPLKLRQTCIENAPTFFDEANDPEQLFFDLEWIKTFPRPVLLTTGDQSPPAYGAVITKLADALPSAEVVTFPGAGHIPHATQPGAYVKTIIGFIRKHTDS
ncbi:alpha/beta fold hydrolase [Nitrospira sp. Nam74]